MATRRRFGMLVAAVILCTGCTEIREPLQASDIAGVYQAAESDAKIVLDGEGTMTFSDFDPSWIFETGTDLISGTGTWSLSPEEQNGRPAFEAIFVAGPEIPGSSAWLYVEDGDDFYLIVGVDPERRVDFHKE